MRRSLIVLVALLAGIAAGLHHEPPALPLAAQADSLASAQPVFIPILNYQGRDDVCRTWVTAQNVGPDLTKAILIAWADPSACPPACQGVLRVECSGLLAPGSTWNFLGAQVPSGAASAMMLSANAKRLAAIGVIGVGGEGADIVADFLCETIFERAVGNCQASTEFVAAYATESSLWGLPLGLTRGSPLAVNVLRHCPGDASPGVEASSSYAGLSGPALGAPDPDRPVYSYVAPQVYGGSVKSTSTFHSYLYVQNAGTACADVQAWFQLRDACEPSIQCNVGSVAPGEVATIDIGACTGPLGESVAGTAVVRSPEPLAIAVDLIGRDQQMSYTGVVTATGLVGVPAIASGDSTTLYGPLIYHPSDGWDSHIHVANLAVTNRARVKVTWMDSTSRPLDSAEDFICTGGSHTFTLPLFRTEGRTRVGSVRVESLPLPSGPGAKPAPITAVAELIRYSDTERSAAVEGVAYNLSPEPMTFHAASEDDGLASGVGLIAIPALPEDLDATGTTGELAVANLVPSRGTTRVAVLRYDQNALVDVTCLELGAQETEYVPYAFSGLPPGFIGSAVISATAWDHPTGGGLNRVGLAANLVIRTGTRIGNDVPGDELASTRGVPLPAEAAPSFAGWGRPFCATPPRPEPPQPPRPTPTPDTSPAAAASWGQVQLPILNFEGQDDVCAATVRIANTSGEPLKAVLVLMSEPGFCPPQCAGPPRILCTGLLAPGGTWEVAPSQMLATKSATLFSLTARTMAEIGAAPGSDEPVADVVCRALAQRLPDDCDELRRFVVAYRDGTPYAGVPLDRAYGGRLAVDVDRDCPGDRTPTIVVSSTYRAPAAAEIAHPFPTPGRHTYYAPLVYARYQGIDSIMYMQNAGDECASLAVYFREQGQPAAERSCSVFILSPGETYQFDATDCVGPEWRGSVVAESDQPLAMVVDHVGNDKLATYTGLPGDNPFDLNFDGVVDERDAQVMADAMGSRPGDTNWNPRADLNVDGVVDQLDWALLMAHFPPGVPTPTPPTPSPEGPLYLPLTANG